MHISRVELALLYNRFCECTVNVQVRRLLKVKGCRKVENTTCVVIAEQSIAVIQTSKGQNPLQQFLGNKTVTSLQLPLLRGSYVETCVMDLGYYRALQ